MYGIFTYIYHKNQASMQVKYTSPMDPMGYRSSQGGLVHLVPGLNGSARGHRWHFTTRQMAPQQRILGCPRKLESMGYFTYSLYLLMGYTGVTIHLLTIYELPGTSK